MLNLNAKNRLQIIDKSKFYNRPYTFFKPDYTPIIPLDIYQTWYTKDLPPKMRERVEILKSQNPRFRHHLYDDNDCREFIKTHFKPDVLWAYDSLIPGAYKADLWRYCVLFIYGGIYLDIKYRPLNGFKFINLTEKEHLVADTNNVDIYNALMVCLPKNELLYKAIRQIVENVKNKYYGDGWLYPTGPALLSNFVSTSEEIVDLKHELINNDKNFKIIYFNNIPILKSYNGHIRERDKYSKKKHYATLWNERRIYL
jgi:mannosyltransferase OCH1-like enzyme